MTHIKKTKEREKQSVDKPAVEQRLSVRFLCIIWFPLSEVSNKTPHEKLPL